MPPVPPSWSVPRQRPPPLAVIQHPAIERSPGNRRQACASIEFPGSHRVVPPRDCSVQGTPSGRPECPAPRDTTGALLFTVIRSGKSGSLEICTEGRLWGGLLPESYPATSLDAFGRRPRCLSHDRDPPSSETLHRSGRLFALLAPEHDVRREVCGSGFHRAVAEDRIEHRLPPSEQDR